MKWLLVLILVLMPSSAWAQYRANETVTVEADHDSVNTDNYDLLLNGQVAQSLPVSAWANGVIRFSFTMPTRGSYTITVRARNDDGLFADSDPTAFTVTKGQPTKPGKPKIISAITGLFSQKQTLLVKFER